MNALSRHQLAHPKPAETILGQSAVACGCDAKLHRPVMFETLAGPGLLRACMNCRTVTCAEARGDDGRFTGESSTVYFQINVADEHLHWLAQWPRVVVQQPPSLWHMHQSWTRSTTLYLPAKLRCKTPEQLEEQEAQLIIEQHSRSTRDRLLNCGFPKDEPPASLPPSFAHFASLWADLQLTPQSDPEHLITRTRGDSLIAAELLMQRSDAESQLGNAVSEGSLDVALLMLRATSQSLPWLEKALIELLDAVPMTPRENMPDRIQKWPRVELALIIAIEQRLNSMAMTTALRAFMRKVARHDATLVNCLRITLRELEQFTRPS
ncbi:MAG: hypothetical protein NTV80_06440 [Verrucomicrobia bacterium]|nr:hypothetical protein [Verrucomicrobiota bacterium]